MVKWMIIGLIIVLLWIYYQKQKKEKLLGSDNSKDNSIDSPENKNGEKINSSISNLFSEDKSKQRTKKSPTRKLPKEPEDCETLQEFLEEFTRRIGAWSEVSSVWFLNDIHEVSLAEEDFDVSGEFLKTLKGGELDLSIFPNLRSVGIREMELKTPLTKLDVSHNPKLTDLWIDAELFVPENKIIGLEKTSIIRLDCQGGNLLEKSKDPKFIWDVFVRKYNVAFPEMKLINIDDLTEIGKQVNNETVKDEEFIKKFSFGNQFWGRFFGSFYWVLDNLANQILERCLIIMNRLYTDENDKEYEDYLIILAKKLECKAMNPKYPEASLYSNREKLVNQALSGDQELLSRLQDLPYLNPKYKFKK